MEEQVTDTFEPKHTPFPWLRFDDGGALPGVRERSGGWKYGPEAADWVWGPRGPGYGVVADCSPHNPCTTQSHANARLIATIPDFVAVCDMAVQNLAEDHPIRAVAEIVLRKAGRAP